MVITYLNKKPGAIGGVTPIGSPDARTFKPSIATYQRLGRSSISSYGEYNIGKYALMPTYNYNPVIGVPRIVNTDMLRRLGDTMWIGMCKRVICTELSSVEVKVVPRDGFEGSYDEARLEAVQEFFDKVNTNGESINDLIYKWADDYLTIGDGLFIKVFYDEVKVEKSLDFNFTKYSFNKSDKEGVHVLKTKDASMKKLITNVPVNYRQTKDKYGNLFELWVPDAATFLINADIEGKLPDKDIPAYWQYNYLTHSQAVGPRPFFKREVIWIKNHPRSDMVYGWSPILDCLPQVECLQGGTRYNQKMFENMSKPDAIISLEGADATTVEEAANHWRDRFNNNPHKLLFVGQKHTYTPLNLTNRDMEWLEGQKQYIQWVMSVFHVTSDELGITETSNRLTGPHQSRVFVRKAINPPLVKLKQAFDNQVIPEFYQPGEDVDLQVELVYDDEVQKQMMIETALNKLQAGVTTINEARNELSLEDVEWGDEPVRQGYSSLLNPDSRFMSEEKQSSQFSKAYQLSETLLKKKFEVLKGDDLKEFFTKYFGLLKSEALKLFERLKDNLPQYVVALKNLFSLPLNQDLLYDIYMKDYHEGVEVVEKQLDLNVLLPEHNPNVMELVKSLNEGFRLSDGTSWHGIKGTNMKLVESIRRSLNDGVKKGESITKLKDRVVELMDTTKARAKMIARTETKRINNIGRLDAALATELPLKKRWVAIHDDKVGDDSLRLDGQVKSLTEEFIDPVGGWHGMVPPHRPNDRCRVEFFTPGMDG